MPPPVRCLHTSDWHLGALFHDRLREDEEQQALDALVDLAGEEAVDAVLIAGDIFDGPNPPASAQDRWYRTLRRFRHEAGVGCVLAIGGNHDHGLRLDAPRAFLAGERIEVRGQLLRDAPAGEVVAPVQARDGRTVAWAALVPYLRDGDVAEASLGEDLRAQAERQAALLQARYAGIQAALAAAAQGLPRLVLAHAFAAGGALGGSERPVIGEQIVGRASLARIDRLADGAALVALGHLHRPQTVAGHEHWRYCGSLLPMAMDETTIPRQVVIAELPPDGGPAHVRTRILGRQRAYARLAGTVPELRARIQALARPSEGGLEPWCDLSVEAEWLDSGLVHELHAQVEAHGWRALSVRRLLRNLPPGGLFPAASDGSGPTLDQVTPESVFAAVAADRGVALDDGLRADFAALVASATGRVD